MVSESASLNLGHPLAYSPLMRLPLILLFAILAAFCMPVSASAASAAGLDAAWEYSASHNGLSLLVLQHGRVLLERYAPGDGPTVRHKIYSGTKGLWCVAALAAQDDGLLKLDEPVAATITGSPSASC
jgi:CubicO group peptidase (beta-lactamase class C family)